MPKWKASTKAQKRIGELKSIVTEILQNDREIAAQHDAAFNDETEARVLLAENIAGRLNVYDVLALAEYAILTFPTDDK